MGQVMKSSDEFYAKIMANKELCLIKSKCSNSHTQNVCNRNPESYSNTIKSTKETHFHLCYGQTSCIEKIVYI